MATLEERVAFLEGRVTEHTRGMDGIRDALSSLEARVDGRFESVDRRFEAIDRRFEAVDRRFDNLERRLDGLDEKISRQFVWLVGVQVTTLAAIVAALAAR